MDGTPEPSAMLIAQDDVHNRSGDYQLGVPLTAYEKQLADQVISAHYSDILKFYETQDPVMIESLETLYTNSQYAVTHPFLLIDHYLPQNLLLKEIPDRIGRSSGKFEVLGHILDLISTLRLQVGLVSRSGKTMDLIEAYILGKKVNYERHSGSLLRPVEELNPNLSTIRLISSERVKNDVPFNDQFKLDLVLAFDQSFLEIDPDFFYALRTFNRQTPAPILRLIPFNSVEHVCFKVGLGLAKTSKVDFLRRVLAPIVVLRGKVGSPPNDVQFLYRHCLRPLQPWFASLGSVPDPWPLPDLPEISEYSSVDIEKSLLTEVGVEAPTPKNESESNDYYQVKRLKREVDFVPKAGSDSTYDSDYSVSKTKSVLTHGLLAKLEHALVELAGKSEEIESFRKVESSRQYQLETALETVAKCMHQISDLESKLQSAERREQRLQSDLARTTTLLENATKDLEESRKMIVEGLPDVAKLAEQATRIHELEAELKKANERVESRVAENDYMRGEYQKASAAAVEAQARITELEHVNAELHKRADGEAVRLRLLSFDEERAAKDDQIKELQARLALMDERMKRMVELEKQPQAGTRGSRFASRAPSVPQRTRSPNSYSRVGSPSVDGQNGSNHPLQTVTRG